MAMVKDMVDSEKPREKGIRFGVRSLSNTELLAILLRTGRKGKSVIDTANELLNKAGGIAGLGRMSIPELTRQSGIGKVKALEILSAFELSRRVAYEEVQEKNLITCPESLVLWLEKEIGNETQEKFLAVYLNNQGRMVHYRILYQGTLNASAVFPREIFKEALLCGSTDIILVHNHPSGDLTPSTSDLLVTKRLQKIGEMMEIYIADHIIVSSNSFYSFAREGILGEYIEEVLKE